MIVVFEIIIYCIIFAVLVGSGFWIYHKEKKAWNNGVCPKCGRRLSRVGKDNKSYMCEGCREYWVWFFLFNPKE